MNRSLICFAVVGVAFATPALAASPFDGTWKVDVKSAQLSTKPDVFAIKDGVFSCASCAPAYKVAADGAPHAVAGHDYWDATSVTVVDPMTIRRALMKNGKSTGEGTETLSADGKTLVTVYRSDNNAKGMMLETTSKAMRVGPAPAGAHAISGSWRATNDVQVADENLTATLSVKGQMLTLSFPTGESYTARFGGPAVAMMGDKAGTMVSVKRAGPNGFVETDMRGGKTVGNNTYTVASPTIMHVKAFDARRNTTDNYTMTKQ